HGVALVGSVTLDDWQPMILLDMSVSGVSFTHATPLEDGAKRVLRFRLPENPFLHQVAIQVVHSATWGVPAGYRVGANFLALEPKTRTAIVEFLEKSFV
ncbi:MAG: PilZ domain-containing protein, partial [Telluria sp.]